MSCVFLLIDKINDHNTTVLSGTVVEPKLMCLMYSEAKQTKTLEFRAEKGLIQGPSKNRGLGLKKTKIPSGFQGRVFKGKLALG